MNKMFKRVLSCMMIVMIVVMLAATALAVGQSTTLAKKGDKYLVAATNGLHVRSSASMGNNIIRTIKKGTNVVFQSEKYGWWRVRYASGRYGWVDKQFLTRTNVPATGTYKTTAALNLRKEPKSYAKAILVIPKNKSVKVTALNGDWVKLTYNGYEGYSAAKYLKK